MFQSSGAFRLHQTHRRLRAVALTLAAATALAAVALASAAPQAQAKGHGTRPLATFPHLGPAPQRCFQYGSSDNICTGPSWPYPPNANYLYATYYGTVYISPHIVGIGHDITATAVPDNKGTPSWSMPPGRIVSGCRDQVTNSAGTVTQAADTTCTWKATVASTYPPDASAPGGGYSEYDMTFCGFFGCASSGDFYYVLPHKKAISGMVYANTTDANGNLVVAPVANAVVQISGASSGTAVTDAAGFYDALVDPGQYTVHVQSVDGQSATSTPATCSPGAPDADGSGCDLDVRGSDGEADFNVCGDSGDAGDVAHAAAAPSLASCPLIVNISWPNMKAPRTAGLTFQPADPSTTDSGGPLFARLKAGNVSCVTGCTLLTVTVKAQSSPGSRNLVAVTDATLTASVTPIAPDPLLAASKQDEGYLCTTGTKQVCGPQLNDLSTDGNGVLRLVYWAPGVIQTKFPSVTVTAEETCSSQACPAKHRHGRDRETLTLMPDVLLPSQRVFFLTDNEKRVMGIWGDATGNTEVINAIGQYLAPSPAGIAQSLIDHVLDAGEADPLFAFAAGAAQVAYGAYSAAQQVEQSLVAEFMHGLKLPEVGLGATDMNWCFSCHNLSPFVQGKFLDAFANWILPRVFGSGTLYKFATAIAKYGVSITDYTVKATMTVTDVSHCDEQKASSTANNGAPQSFSSGDSFNSCGPGYFDDGAVPPTCASTLPILTDSNAWSGIDGFLYVHFEGSLDHTSGTVGHPVHTLTPLVKDAFVVPYNPFDWMYALHCSGP